MNTSTGMPSLRAVRPRQFADRERLGRDHDGGYVLPRRMVTASQALLSLGVEADWSFEEALLAIAPGLEVTCVDGTTGPEIIRARVLKDLGRVLRQLRLLRAVQIARGLGKPAAFRRFFARHRFLKLMVAGRSGPGLATLAELLAAVRGGDASRWVLVKMDIEGSEYEVLAASRELWPRVAGLVIEFHALDQHWPEFEAEMAALGRWFHVAHVHGNNNDGCIAGTGVPRVLELTLVNRALCEGEPPPSTERYPLPGLDRPCKPGHPDLPLSFE
ncbi:MAG TPA: FkbM family methyltransferase [Steroidobacteraceae bacterium]|nr:FkbM family methyltransferase [Steroidobacteraceae bacterium]